MTGKWTDELFAQAVQLNREGKPAAQIAELLNARHGTSFSRNAVIGKFHRSKVDMQSITANTVRDRAALATYRARKKAARKQQPVQPKHINPVPLPTPSRKQHRLPPARAYGVEAVLSLQAHDCRYPIGQPQDDDFRFCGSSRMDGSPYCAHHHEACNIGVPKRA